MSHRNLSELFFMLRNNVLYNKNIYADGKNSDNEVLLDRSGQSDNSSVQVPTWIGKYDEAHYLLSKIKTKIDDLIRIQESHARSVLSDNPDSDQQIDSLAREISKLIGTCHSHIKGIKSISQRSRNSIEVVLLENVEKNLLLMLQHTTEKFRTSQKTYKDEKTNLEKRSQIFFENFTNDDQPKNSVESFDNFLNMDQATNVTTSMNAFLDDDERLDEYFQMSASQPLDQRRMLMIEADNIRLVESREQEVNKIVNSIVDLNVVFKDLSQLVQEQGTVLDRIDYNIECTQTKVFEGYKQLAKAESYQRKNRKVICILILAAMLMFMVLLTIFTKF